jgi:AcrR family transcriptional regulator
MVFSPLTREALLSYTPHMETLLPNDNGVLTHQQVKAQGKGLLRQAVLDAAYQLLDREGPEALTVRRLAATLHCSTKVIYTLFEGKDGVANALCRESSRLMYEAIQAVKPGARASDYLREVARAYWTFAEQHAGFYRAIFCGAIPNFQPDESFKKETTAGTAAIGAQLDAYRRQGLLEAAEPHQVMNAWWAPLHGVISLYVQGYFTPAEARALYEATIAMLVAALESGQNR